jgi:hypothetical protein
VSNPELRRNRNFCDGETKAGIGSDEEVGEGFFFFLIIEGEEFGGLRRREKVR